MTTADKEREARQKLEVFIEDLIKRAEQAESELHVLKSQSTQSASTLHDVKMGSFSDIHNSESTARKRYCDKLESHSCYAYLYHKISYSPPWSGG
jgi:hypothetical protein